MARNRFQGLIPLERLTKAEVGQDDADDDYKAYDVNDGVHDFLLGMVDAPMWAPSKY